MVNTTQVLQLIAVIVGSILLGISFGWMIGTGICLLAWAIMPYS